MFSYKSLIICVVFCCRYKEAFRLLISSSDTARAAMTQIICERIRSELYSVTKGKYGRKNLIHSLTGKSQSLKNGYNIEC